ncbi:MAG: InlB B-repeat-containing protein [Clostridiales bacterium]|nr:InlB B-repeat-containing protein [Clostridiales bacterium]
MKNTCTSKSIKINLLIICCVLSVLLLALFFSHNEAKAAAEDSGIDYTFEEVPVEIIQIDTDSHIKQIKPGESFSITFEMSPWYTTTDRIYFDILPIGVAVASDISTIQIKNGQAMGTAIITVSPEAEVGSEFTVTANANDVASNEIRLTIVKIPVEQIKLSFADSDDKLHVGKSKQVLCEVFPQTATNQNIRYELSGTGAQYVKNIDENTGIVTAISNVSDVKADSTVIVTAFSEDNPSISDSIVMSFYVPTINVELSASTPLGGKTPDDDTLAVANSVIGETVKLSATVNGVNTTGLNYVIVKGREYVENGLIRSDGSFTVKSTSAWTNDMCQPHAEIRVRAAYSDGFDEIGISIYVPVEKISFVNDDVPNNVENNRTYDLSVKAFPEYATFLNDCSNPFLYTLNGLDKNIASVNNKGILSLPKSITSKGSIINYTAYFNGAWDGVDVEPFVHTMSIVPVSANNITNVVIKKDGVSITDKSVNVIPADVLKVEVEFDKDNVTELDFDLIEDSTMLSVSSDTITIADLKYMIEDNPNIPITLKYKGEKSEITKQLFVLVYVPAMTARIDQALIARDVPLNLQKLVIINGHGFASDKTITWGEVKINDKKAVNASCNDGFLHIDNTTNAGSRVTVTYKTYDNDIWFEHTFIVASLDNSFDLTYSQIIDYTVNVDAPQLEEGQSVSLKLRYKGISGKSFGLTYKLYSTSNSTFVEKAGDRNDFCDEFILSALSGQSGRDNNIGYLIEIIDGTAIYYIGTQDYVEKSRANVHMKNIAIFNRINGNISVSNKSIEEGETFILIGWDTLATFDEKDLSWSINGQAVIDKVLTGAPNCAFVLKISASQPYNNTYITFSAEIAFSPIIYKSEIGEILKKTYKKSDETIKLANSLNEVKANYAQTGWSTSINGAKDYELESLFSENKDLTLYAYWNLTLIEESIGSSYVSDSPLPNDFCSWRTVDTISGFFNSYTSVDALKKIGYTTVTISINMHIYIYGDVEMYLQIYDAISDKELSCSGLYHSPNGDSFDTTYTFTFDISDLDNTHEIQLRFKGRRYVAVWGGRVTLESNRHYTVKFA